MADLSLSFDPGSVASNSDAASKAQSAADTASAAAISATSKASDASSATLVVSDAASKASSIAHTASAAAVTAQSKASDASSAAAIAATTTAAGRVELATSAEIGTGTDTSRALSPNEFAGSIFGQKAICIVPIESDTDVAVADGKVGFTVPMAMDGMDLIDVIVSVHTKGTTGTTDIQIRRRRAGSDADMLSTKITLGDEFFVSDEVIDGNNDDIEDGDQIYIDVDAIHTTAPKGLSVVLTFKKP